MILAGPLPGGLGGTLSTTLCFTLKPHSTDEPSYSATHIQTLADLQNFTTGRLRWKPSGIVQSDDGTLGLHTSLLYPVNESVHRHQEITLVCICRLRICLHVTMSLNDIYVSNNFYLISLRQLIFNQTYICCIGIKQHIMLCNIYS